MYDQGKKPLLVIDTHCSRFLASLKNSLAGAGLWTFQSFDLRSTRALHEGCTCPNHGTSQCTCELVVLLVYRSIGDPVTLILDGRDGKTFVFLTIESGRLNRDPSIEAIEAAIQEAATIYQNQETSIDAD